jgi:hypothetical protein
MHLQRPASPSGAMHLQRPTVEHYGILRQVRQFKTNTSQSSPHANKAWQKVAKAPLGAWHLMKKASNFQSALVAHLRSCRSHKFHPAGTVRGRREPQVPCTADDALLTSDGLAVRHLAARPAIQDQHIPIFSSRHRCMASGSKSPQ